MRYPKSDTGTAPGARFAPVCLLLAGLAILAGCAESSRPVATGKAAIRGINALIDSPDAQFLIEESPLGSLGYKDSSAERSFDNLSYNFNFDIRVPGSVNARRLATLLLDVVKDTEYQFVLVGSVATPEILLWQNAKREWASTETVFELAFGLATASLGDVDVYFAAAGTPPVPGNQVATLAFRDRTEPREFPAGNYELLVTAANDPSTVLYRSLAADYGAAVTNTIVIFEGDPSTTSPVNARLVPASGATVEIPDADYPPTIRFLHASIATGNVDVAENDDFANLLAANLGFGEVSPDAEALSGQQTINWVATGNTTPIFSDANRQVVQGVRFLHLLLGEPDSYGVTVLPSIRRSISTAARIRVTHGSLNVDGTIDVYLAEPGRPLTELVPITSFVPFSASTGIREVANGDYELTITRGGNRDTVIAGPVPVALELGDIVEIVVLDTADPNAGDLLIFSNLP